MDLLLLALPFAVLRLAPLVEEALCGPQGVAVAGFDLADEGVLGGRPAAVGDVTGVPPLLVSPLLFLLPLVVTMKIMSE